MLTTIEPEGSPAPKSGAGPALMPILAPVLAQPGWRVKRLEGPWGTAWLKRIERLSLRLRLQKGDPRRAVEAECAGLRILAEAGVPVPEVLAAGRDWFAVADAGPTLSSLLSGPETAARARAEALPAVGRAFARLHGAGYAHGRPVLRDLCWDGRTLRFIDLERFRPGQSGDRTKAIDFLCLAQSTFTRFLGAEGEAILAPVIAAYEQAGGSGAVLSAAAALGFWLAPLGWLARLAAALRPQSREAAAVAPTLRWLARLRAPAP